MREKERSNEKRRETEGEGKRDRMDEGEIN